MTVHYVNKFPNEWSSLCVIYVCGYIYHLIQNYGFVYDGRYICNILAYNLLKSVNSKLKYIFLNILTLYSKK